jgi:hypothetical protein
MSYMYERVWAALDRAATVIGVSELIVLVQIDDLTFKLGLCCTIFRMFMEQTSTGSDVILASN